MQVIVSIEIECESVYSQQKHTMCLLEVVEDDVDLLGHFSPSLFLVTLRVAEAPGVHPI